MKILLDTNVLLDVWTAREPFWRDSTAIVARVETHEFHGIICPRSITTLHYLGRRVLGEKRVRELLTNLLSVFEVGTITAGVFDNALQSKIADFEDAVLEAVALTEEVDLIVTRNKKDFRNSRVPAKEPSELI